MSERTQESVRTRYVRKYMYVTSSPTVSYEYTRGHRKWRFRGHHGSRRGKMDPFPGRWVRLMMSTSMEADRLSIGARPPRTKLLRQVLAFVSACVLGACAGDSANPGSSASLDDPEGPTTVHSTDADWAVVQEKALWAVDQGYADLGIGDLVARIGETFVGTPYAPYTLEVPGDEGLVIELEELDCVTFVENVLALARFVQTAPDQLEVAPAGSLIFFSPHTVHGSRPNLSGRQRRALVLTYQPGGCEMFKVRAVRSAGHPGA